jgi:phage recombination protein Bet
MGNELMTRPEQAVTQKTVEDFLFSSGTKLNQQQKAMFLNLAVTFGLNPFKKEIYAVPFGSGFNYVTGYQVYISRAEATGKLDGWGVEAIKEGGKLTGARATIYRKDWSKFFVWEVSLSEFNRNSGNWKTMPEFMLKKVCLAQAFRLCFPNEFSGMPYIAEEIVNEPVKDITPSPAPIVEAQSEDMPLADVDSLCKKLNEAGDLETLRQAWECIQPAFRQLDPEAQAKVKGVKGRLKMELSKEVNL